MSDPLSGLPGAGDAGAAGAYTSRLLRGGSFATRFSHRGRMATAASLVQAERFDRAADVGAADGWYLRTLLDQGTIAEGVAVDADPAMLQVGQQRSEGRPLEFLTPDDDALLDQLGTFDLVTCLETLEHVADPSSVLQLAVDLAAPGATIVVSVPIEVGPSVLLKQAGRWLANRRQEYGYERYRWAELFRAGVLGQSAGLDRVNLHSHKGFDYRDVREMLRARAAIHRTVYSPIRTLGPVVASTVFWIARAPTG